MTYRETHPWLRFTLDAKKLDHYVWILLGEAVSKAEHIAGIPLQPNYAENLHRIYLARGALATTAIEGNTLSEDEVMGYIEGRLKLPPSRAYLGQEIDNIVNACNRIRDRVLSERSDDFSVEDILNYNDAVLKKLPLAEDVAAGRIREFSAVVGRYRCPPAGDCRYLLKEFCDWINGIEYRDRFRRHYSIFTAVAAHLFFVWIHPFGDGNGRTARLIEFRLLLQAGFPTPAAHLLSNFYNQTRTEYYNQLDYASRSKGNPDRFIKYALGGLVDQLDEQISDIRKMQLEITWRNFVFEAFEGRESSAVLRRRSLVLALSRNVGDDGGWMNVSELTGLSAETARLYASRTARTLYRDVEALIGKGFLERRGRWVRANIAAVTAFLPLSRDEHGSMDPPPPGVNIDKTPANPASAR